MKSEAANTFISCLDCRHVVNKINFRKHLQGRSCKPNSVSISAYKQDGFYKCPKCSKKFSKNGIASHIWRVHGDGISFNPNRGYKNGSRIVWNKGLSKEMDGRLVVGGKKYSENYHRKYNAGLLIPHRQTVETRRKLSEYAIKQGFGGHTSKHRIIYLRKDGNLIHLQSSYEIRVAEELDKNKIDWDRPNPLLYLDSQGKSHRYYADFYLPSYGVYLDTKNDYLISKDREKLDKVREQNKIKLVILDKNTLLWKSICALLAQ